VVYPVGARNRTALRRIGRGAGSSARPFVGRATGSGSGLLLTGIFGFSVYNYVFTTVDRETIVPALALAFATGAFVALYTTYDAYGIRATATPSPSSPGSLHRRLVIPAVTSAAGAAFRPPRSCPLMRRGLLGRRRRHFSFGGIMLATRLDKVGEAAVLRETHVFAALIGWLVLGESTGPRRIMLMSLIALGAVIVEAGG